MTQGTVSYTGITKLKGGKYRQIRGIAPDLIQVKMVPQATSIPATGTITFAYGVDTVTLPNCLADFSNVRISKNGFTGSITFQDRRWKWSRYPAVSYHWNERDAEGELITATQLHLRGMVSQLLEDIGELSYDVTDLPIDFYPEVDVYCMRPDLLLDQITSEWGFGICLGFGSDAVIIPLIGSGTILPVTNVMMREEGLNPPTPPQYVRTCFAPSVAQARFKLLAVGLDTDGTVKLLDDLSYRPTAGWELEHPDMPNVFNTYGENSAEYKLAMSTVYRWYVVNKFADGTLVLPDGSGTLSAITDILPLKPRLLETEVRSGRPHHPQPRVYGKHMRGTAPTQVHSLIDDVVGVPFTLDKYRGLVQFSKPMYQIYYAGEEILAAELYLEAAFNVRNSTTNQFNTYAKDIEVDAAGSGYHNIHETTQYARTIVTYGASHAVSGSTNNGADLDTLAAELSSNALGAYTYSARDVSWYNRIMHTIRLDGLISEINHVITDGDDDEPGNYTVASRNMNVDPFSRSETQRRYDLYVLNRHREFVRNLVVEQRPRKGNE